MAAAGRGGERVVTTDVLVVGTGVAGLTVALAAGPRSVLIASKTRMRSGSSPLAQGGIAAAVGRDDHPHHHAEDTLRVGRGLGVAEIVNMLVSDARSAIDQLVERGVSFDAELGREGGHGRDRVLHAGGDRTGAAIVEALAHAVREAPHVRIAEDLFVIDVLRSGDRVVGVVALDGGERVTLLAHDVVLATGGLGQIYRYTTNPAELTGDGIAMAARAGAELIDLEFVQFHPTTIALGEPGGPQPLLTEALRGAGAWLVDEDGRRFMQEVHPDAELAPRDVVAREVFRRRAFLDLRPISGELDERFPTAVSHCRAAHIDPNHELVPVSPAAHYAMGGVAVGADGQTTRSGLWACGETASTGAHGANRLASNSLLEALVFGKRLGLRLRGASSERPRRFDVARAGDRDFPGEATSVLDTVRRLMWDHAGVERDANGLTRAIDTLEQLRSKLESVRLRSRFEAEAKNAVLVARLVAQAALVRRETRGAHYRSDFPHAELAFERRHPMEAPVHVTV